MTYTRILRNEDEPNRVPVRKNGVLTTHNGALVAPRGPCCRVCTCGPHNPYSGGGVYPASPLTRMSFTLSGQTGVGVYVNTPEAEASGYCTYPGYGGPWYGSFIWPDFPFHTEGFCTTVWFFFITHDDTSSSFWTDKPTDRPAYWDWSQAYSAGSFLRVAVAVEVVCDAYAPPETWTVLASVSEYASKSWSGVLINPSSIAVPPKQFWTNTTLNYYGCFAKRYRWNNVTPSAFNNGVFTLTLQTQNASDSACAVYTGAGCTITESTPGCKRNTSDTYFPLTPQDAWTLSFQILP